MTTASALLKSSIPDHTGMTSSEAGQAENYRVVVFKSLVAKSGKWIAFRITEMGVFILLVDLIHQFIAHRLYPKSRVEHS